MTIKVIATNRKARHEYTLLDTYEAGLVLLGSEIKSIRNGHISIKEAYVRIDEDGQEAWLINAHIGTYDPASLQNHDPRRRRKLLLHRKQIFKLWNSVRQKGTTIVPLKIYLSEGRAKIEIALARGKRKYDKRQSIAQKDMEREVQRQMKRR